MEVKILNSDIRYWKNRAEGARALYRQNKITRAEAYEDILPYIELYNKKSKEIAKKYNQNPKTINFASFVR